MDTTINDLIDRAKALWEQDEPLPLDLMVAMEEAGIIIEKAHAKWLASL